MMVYDQMTRDLAFKAGDDAVAAIYRSMALHDALANIQMIAIMAAGQCLAVATGALAASSNLPVTDRTTAEALADALWEHIRPITVSAALSKAAPA